VLGANGAMGAGSAALFASGGCDVTLVARDIAKDEAAITAMQGIAKSEVITSGVKCATYDDLAAVCANADLIFECLAEDLALKKDLFARVDAVRPPDALVATVSSGLSIREMCEGRSQGFCSHFAGIHLYNPPHVMIGVEVIAHPDMPGEVVDQITEILSSRFGRAVVPCADTPAFAGNRIGFKVMNEVAQLAATHGVQMMDYLIGPYTGRAMSPLATVDLVGWDVHKAIVDNVAANVRDEAAASFVMPAYMNALVAKGHLGDKTPATGGFYRKDGKSSLALDPRSGEYRPTDPALRIDFVEEVRQLHRSGHYQQGIDRFVEAPGAEADLARKVVLGYMGYALNRAGPGEVCATYADIDRIMTAGFNWAPPSGMADLIGYKRAVQLLEKHELPRCAIIEAAARGDLPTPLFNLPYVVPGRYFAG
jgi:3-hydroxyacyl-CoA dehydrogenase